MRKWLLTASAVVLLAACSNGETETKETAKKTETTEQPVTTEQPAKKVVKKNEKTVKNGVTYYDGILIVNKQITLPSTYAPGEDPIARKALNRLLAAGNQVDGLQFVVRSGYRSYQEQEALYNDYVARDGQAAADTYSARPGHSEHQTGLTYDIGSVESANDFTVSFGTTPEGAWLKQHAHEYGFIIRYPEGKEKITGYQYEPWHIRYVGQPLAKKLYNSGQILEEYFHLI